jgi:hypothetical protein
MRKSKRPPPPAPFVYLRDVLPQLAADLRHSFRQEGERELADQIHDLRIYGRCCDGSPCGCIFCLPGDERRHLSVHGRKLEWVADCIVVDRKIVEVETFSAEVDAVLRSVFPVAEHRDEPE